MTLQKCLGCGKKISIDPDDELKIYHKFEEGIQKVNIKVLDRVLN